MKMKRFVGTDITVDLVLVHIVRGRILDFLDVREFNAYFAAHATGDVACHLRALVECTVQVT